MKDSVNSSKKQNNAVFRGIYIVVYKETIEGRKTPIYSLESVYDKVFLGEVKWYGPWRRYCFYPCDNTVWDVKCLEELENLMKDINKGIDIENEETKED